MARYEWTTAKGARVAIEVEKVEYTETAYADGWNVDLKKAEKRIVRMTVNGQQVEAPRFWMANQAQFRMGGRTGAAIIPDTILAEIWAEERAALAAELERGRKLEADRRKIEEAMRE